MPTTRPRHQITETPAVERALDVAARRWPSESRAGLLRRLVDAGAAALAKGQDDAARARAEAVDATSGKYGEAFGSDHLASLRQDWPD